MRDKNGRFIPNKKYKAVETHSRSSKIISKPLGISSRLRQRPEENSTKHIPFNKEMRITRSRVNFNKLNSTSQELKRGEEEKKKPQQLKKEKKRHAKSMEKDLSICDNQIENANTQNGKEVSSRTILMLNKSIAIYQEYDDFLKRKRKDRRVEFIKNK